MRWLITVALATVLVLGCGPSGEGGNGGAADASGSGGDGGPQGDLPDASCGAQEENIEVVNLGEPPDLLIVLDRSGSMLSPPGLLPFGTSRWNIMKSALQTITQTYDQEIRFGLSLFPTHDACGVNPGPAAAIGLGQSGAIMSAINGNAPQDISFTPAQFGLQEALDIYNSIPANPDGRYVLFATDGLPNCGGTPVDSSTSSNTETVQAVTALASAGIKTFVIGFSVFGIDPTVLNNAALAGQVPKPGGPPHFYQADNATELQQALEQITGGIILPSCSFALSEQPPDPDLVTVKIDGNAVPRDPSHQDGWDYYPDMSTITFFGSYCNMIESGGASSVRFLYGCPGPIIE